jgi:hypothetical protein
MAIGDIFKLSVVGEAGQGQELVCNFHYQQEDALILDTPGEDLVQAWREEVEDLWLATFSSAALLDHYEVRGVTDPTYGFDFSIGEPRPVGGIGGEALPAMTSAIVTWRTALIGRSNRGRTYMWQIGESSQSGGRVTNAYIALMDAWASAAQEIDTTLTHAGWNLGVLSRFHNHNKRPEPVFNLVTDHRNNSLLGTQRRRRLGVGS